MRLVGLGERLFSLGFGNLHFVIRLDYVSLGLHGLRVELHAFAFDFHLLSFLLVRHFSEVLFGKRAVELALENHLFEFVAVLELFESEFPFESVALEFNLALRIFEFLRELGNLHVALLDFVIGLVDEFLILHFLSGRHRLQQFYEATYVFVILFDVSHRHEELALILRLGEQRSHLLENNAGFLFLQTFVRSLYAADFDCAVKRLALNQFEEAHTGDHEGTS